MILSFPFLFIPIHFFLFAALVYGFFLYRPTFFSSFLWLYEAGLGFYLHIQIPPYFWAIDLVLEEIIFLDAILFVYSRAIVGGSIMAFSFFIFLFALKD